MVSGPYTWFVFAMFITSPQWHKLGVLGALKQYDVSQTLCSYFRA